MVDFDTDEVPVGPSDNSAPSSHADRIRETTFPLAVRGYDRNAVDQFLNDVYQVVQDLESRQTRETVVQRALNEVGEETAGILQRAHETADEIASRSRAQAEGRIQRADREAEITRSQADEYSEALVADTRLLWEERQRLLEDIRQLADEVLATADEAAERLSLPEHLGAGPDGLEEPVDQPTAEVELDLLPGGAEADETVAFETDADDQPADGAVEPAPGREPPGPNQTSGA